MSFLDKFLKKKEDNVAEIKETVETPVVEAAAEEVEAQTSAEVFENSQLLTYWQAYLAEQTPENMSKAFEEVCVNGKFLLLSNLPMTDDKEAVGEKVDLAFATLANPSGEQFFPVFTDWQSLKAWQPELTTQAFVMDFNDLAQLVLEREEMQGFAINPFSENILFTEDMIRNFRGHQGLKENGHGEVVLDGGTSLQIGEPEEYPTEMIAAITAALKEKSEVKRAWLRLMKNGGEVSYLVVVDFAGSREVLFPALAEIGMPYLKGMFLDLVEYQSDFGKNAVAEVAPFYEK
ncbi:hypothetical protein M2139_000430 [Enterococcus sp. PF1-24]|uniref:enhanced serine sensitivity protein SseB n=1 Tax=unclassified Enterococcus TaxID=2608891 RepID=UPI002476278D|nr:MULTISPECIES: enhanced serine sensitivity protein SseB [unclassified Enterococcus]MDH6363455.1 hypothetical protein [Enterococcus sp. PFB1-1]MDH6400549.1 hypothetical protein [Enterococcus sp. PF1-24]